MSPGAIEEQGTPRAHPEQVEFETAPFLHTGPLAGKVALITGAGRGIGKGIALELGSRGASVVVNYSSSASKAAEVVKEIIKSGSKAIALKADLREPEEIFKLFEDAIARFGRLDIVISNSGRSEE